jgi:hypothetical protein
VHDARLSALYLNRRWRVHRRCGGRVFSLAFPHKGEKHVEAVLTAALFRERDS